MSDHDEALLRQRFIEGLFANGKVVWEENYNPEEKIPNGVTHVAKRDENGQITVRRICFNAF